jgi:hypothetical protein
MAGAGCTAIDLVQIVNPSTSLPTVVTQCSPVNSQFPAGFSGSIISSNTFTDPVSDATLTISSSPSGVPEPSSLLLLAGGATVLWVRRKWFV